MSDGPAGGKALTIFSGPEGTQGSACAGATSDSLTFAINIQVFRARDLLLLIAQMLIGFQSVFVSRFAPGGKEMPVEDWNTNIRSDAFVLARNGRVGQAYPRP